MEKLQKIVIAMMVVLIVILLAMIIFLSIQVNLARSVRQSSIITNRSSASSIQSSSSINSSSLSSSSLSSSSIALPTCGGTLVSGGPVVPGTVELVSGNYIQPGFVDGLIDEARFENTIGIALDPQNCILYVADNGNNRIRTINLNANPKIVGTVIGTGTQNTCPSLSTIISNNPTSVDISLPNGLLWDDRGQAGKYLLICEFGNNRILELNIDTNQLNLWAGSSTCVAGVPDGSNRTSCLLDAPTSIVKNSLGEYYVACQSFSAIPYIAYVNLQGNMTPIISNPSVDPDLPLTATPNEGPNVARTIISFCNALAIGPRDELYFNSRNELGEYQIGIYVPESGSFPASVVQRNFLGFVGSRSLLWIDTPAATGLLIGTEEGQILLSSDFDTSAVLAGIPQVIGSATNTDDGLSYTDARFSVIQGMTLDSYNYLWVTLGGDQDANGYAVRVLHLD